MEKDFAVHMEKSYCAILTVSKLSKLLLKALLKAAQVLELDKGRKKKRGVN